MSNILKIKSNIEFAEELLIYVTYMLGVEPSINDYILHWDSIQFKSICLHFKFRCKCYPCPSNRAFRDHSKITMGDDSGGTLI